MTVTATAPATTSRSRTASRIVAALLLVGWLLALVPAVSGLEREVSYGQLRKDLRAGEVGAVTVTGDVLGHDEAGYSVVDVHWRRGWWGYTTEVTQVRGDHDPVPEGDTAIDGSVSDALRSLRPGLDISVEPYRSGATTTLLGDVLTGRWAAAVFVLLLATLMLIVGGPEPRVATRWAWFWLLAVVPPVAEIAFLVLGGSVAGREHDGSRKRLTGGWAFLIAVVLGGATSSGVR
jgi:hypothetical protein